MFLSLASCVLLHVSWLLANSFYFFATSDYPNPQAEAEPEKIMDKKMKFKFKKINKQASRFFILDP
jgi:hypothetical protein